MVISKLIQQSASKKSFNKFREIATIGVGSVIIYDAYKSIYKWLCMDSPETWEWLWLYGDR